MVINHNIAALNTLSNLSANTKATQTSLQRLSTGSKINKAADDASGLAISQKMQAQINGLDQGQQNVSDGANLIQTAEGSLGNIQDILQKIRTLAVQANNDTQSTDDKGNLQDQADALAQEITRISEQTTYNTKHVLNSSDTTGLLANSTGLKIQIGADDGQSINITLSGVATIGSTAVSSVDAAGLGVASSAGATATAGGAVDLLTANAITTIQSAIDAVSKLRSKLGAYQNRLDYAGQTDDLSSQNLTQALSGITDTDIAKEMMTYTKNNILVQSAQAMLAQANQLPQGMLSLLKA